MDALRGDQAAVAGGLRVRRGECPRRRRDRGERAGAGRERGEAGGEGRQGERGGREREVVSLDLFTFHPGTSFMTVASSCRFSLSIRRVLGRGAGGESKTKQMIK